MIAGWIRNRDGHAGCQVVNDVLALWMTASQQVAIATQKRDVRAGGFEGPELIAAALRGARLCVYRGHGIWASDSDVDLAYKWTCSLEQSARIAVLASSMGVTT